MLGGATTPNVAASRSIITSPYKLDEERTYGDEGFDDEETHGDDDEGHSDYLGIGGLVESTSSAFRALWPQNSSGHPTIPPSAEALSLPHLSRISATSRLAWYLGVIRGSDLGVISA